jgi:hypothetical protein
MGLEVGTALAGTIGQDGTAQQGAAGIEAATGITNHPLVVPPVGVLGLGLGLHLQSNGRQPIKTINQFVAVAPLQDQVTLVLNDEPASGLGHIGQGFDFEGCQ